MGNFNSIEYLDATCDLSLLNKKIKLYHMGFIFIQTMQYYSTHIFFLLGKFFKREQPKLVLTNIWKKYITLNINVVCIFIPMCKHLTGLTMQQHASTQSYEKSLPTICHMIGKCILYTKTISMMGFRHTAKCRAKKGTKFRALSHALKLNREPVS